MTHELRDADAGMVAATVNELIKWFCELNYGGAETPVFSLWDQEAQDALKAARDKSNFEAGARFTNAYWERAYGYKPGDLAAPDGASVPAALAGAAPDAAAFAEAALAAGGADPLASDVDALQAAAEPAWGAMLAQVQAIVDRAQSMTDLQRAITSAYGALDSAQLVKLMAAALALAELKGMEAALHPEDFNVGL